MQYINGISEVTNPILIFAPIILMLLSGYSVGRLISKIRKVKSLAIGDLTLGNIVLNFLFIFGFIICGMLFTIVKTFYFYFTIILIILTLLSIIFLLRSSIGFHKKIKDYFSGSNIISLFGTSFFTILFVFTAIIVYYHPIFLEYDPVNNYLLTSKSILLGNGLNHDYYGGVDVRVMSPPLNNAINAWIMDIFGYSSLRLFPIYFIFISSLFVYRLSKRFTTDSFLGWISASAFLLTPCMLESNSHFSLYPDTSFILFLVASFYFLVHVITRNKIAKTDLLMLTVSLSMMTLSKEIGLILTWEILLVVLYIKFSSNNRKLKVVYSVFAFLPFYLLAFNDFRYYGVTAYTSMRLIEMFLASLGLFYMLKYLSKGERSKFRFRSFIYFTPLLVPLIFLSINIIMIHGPYASIVFSETLNNSINSYQTVMGAQNKHTLDIGTALEKVPRIDILFTAILLGTLFVFFKLSGFVTLLRNFKINTDHAVILTMFLLLLTVWAYLDLGTNPTDVRHISYFVPIFAIILVLGLRKKTAQYKLFYYGVMSFCLYYFIFQDLLMPQFNGHFGGFTIDSQKEPTITLIGVELSAILILSLILLELKESSLIRLFTKIRFHQFLTKNNHRVIAITFVVLLSLNVFTLSASGIVLESTQKTDTIPQEGWEINEMEVIDFLNHSEKGNVVSLQTQAISFFTNRTSYELFDTHTFAAMLSILKINDATEFKQKVSSLGIKYFVFPNENSPLYDRTQRFNKIFNTTNILENDPSFKKVILKSHSIYEFVG